MLNNSFVACSSAPFDLFPQESEPTVTPRSAEPASKPGGPPDKEPAAAEGLILPPPTGK